MPNYIQKGKRRDKEETYLKGCFRIKHILGVAFFGKWLRQVDKTPSVTCRAEKQMNKCVWDYVGGRVVCLRFLCLWFFGFFGFRVCVVLFVCLWFWGRGCLVWFFLMLCRIST